MKNNWSKESLVAFLNDPFTKLFYFLVWGWITFAVIFLGILLYHYIGCLCN
jgi:hypothetical protein